MTGLTPAQIVARRKGIGSSDALTIISGAWRDLWEVKTNRKEPPNLGHILPVRIGVATEAFNAQWFEQTTGHAVSERGRHVVSADHPEMRANLDGVVASLDAVWEAKHVNSAAEIADVVARYAPQVHHQMICRRFSKAVLSILSGTLRYVAVLVDRDEAWASAYVERCGEFWRHVETDTPPPAVVPMRMVARAKYAQVEAVDRRVGGGVG